MARPPLPSVAVKADAVALSGGLDLVSAPLSARPGTARFASNYEPAIGGGYERLGGVERFDGRLRPSDALYTAIAPATTFSGVVVGNTVNGLTSGATGKVIYITAAYIAVTRVTGTFTPGGETIRVGVTSIGASSAVDPTITVQADAELAYLAGEDYRVDITKVPGSGRIRGVAILSDVVYAWRDNAGATAMAIYKSTSSGWTAVTLYHQISFTAGSAVYAEGSTLTQGGVTATVKRVVLQSGSWAGGTAAGRLIITAPSGGVFAAGAAVGGGACTLSGASALIALSPGGRVVTDVHNFTGSTDTKRLYGCDGVNQEFEFDGAVYVPISTGMGSVRATTAKVHKNHLFFFYLGSLQHSGTGTPYIWSPIFGAAELGTGDIGTGLITVGGSEATAALMVFCKDSTWVLYGNDATSWDFQKISEEAGATAFSAQTLGKPITHDAPGFRVVSPTQRYGNFDWELASLLVTPIVKGLTPVCSVVARARGIYRVFFSDGTAIVGMLGNGAMDPRTGEVSDAVAWMSIDYGRTITVAVNAEIAGVSRTFYGDSDGWVLEADVGTSFDGDYIDAALWLSALNQRSPVVLKQYRRCDIEASGFGLFTLSISAEFSDQDVDIDQAEVTTLDQQGPAMRWDIDSWDRAYWESGGLARRRFTLNGFGHNISPLISSRSRTELPHQIKSLMLQYTPRRIGR